jgi:hypothetical protein
MKKFTLIALIAILGLIGFAFISCDNPAGGSNGGDNGGGDVVQWPAEITGNMTWSHDTYYRITAFNHSSPPQLYLRGNSDPDDKTVYYNLKSVSGTEYTTDNGVLTIIVIESFPNCKVSITGLSHPSVDFNIDNEYWY